jgi:hypothetical protein
MHNRIAIASVAACLGVFPLAAYAQKGHVAERIQTANGQLCMNAKADRASDGTPVVLRQCSGGESERWTVTESADGKAAIIGAGGYCLDVRGAKSQANGTPVQLWKCTFDPNQRFTIGGQGRIHESASGKCLVPQSVKDGAAVTLEPCSGKPAEAWRFQ